MDMRRCCGFLSVGLKKEGKRIHQWMRNLGSASTEEASDNFKASTGSRCLAKLKYLQRAWLSYEEMWVHHSIKCSHNFGILRTSRVWVGNGHSKHGLSMRSNLFDVFSRIMRRKEELGEVKCQRIIM